MPGVEVPDPYRRIARHYDRLLEPLNSSLRSIAMGLVTVAEGTSVLDVGCGTGVHLEAFADAGARCVGLDLSPSMLDVARRRLGDRVELHLGDATSLSFADASFDLVISSLFLHELDPDARRAALAEMVRVTAPTGRIVITDYRSGRLRWKGWALRLASTATERVAGAEHFRNWRRYLADGALPGAAPQAATVQRTKPVAGGNLAIWVLSPNA
jgi:ubiquinone/menaquinone biosynthesis C-methylase UbiE